MSGGQSSNVAERLIVIDWGTSNFRAFLVDTATHEVLDSRRSASGLRALSQSEFPHYCASQIDDWRNGGGAASGAEKVPVYLAGMVGSARGWFEAPQLELPASASDLADNVVAAPGLDNVWIVPGVKQVTPEHVDVMRGEEVQAFGALALAGHAASMDTPMDTPMDSGDCCLPGTHSKWARLDAGRMTEFTTVMTGELYHAVRFHTLPGEPARDDAPFDEAAFRLGVSRAGCPGGVMHALFEARSRHLYAGLEAAQVGSFLSGVLIGEEVHVMRKARPGLETVHLIGAESLRESYTIALEAAGIRVEAVDSDQATIAGVIAVAARHGVHDTMR